MKKNELKKNQMKKLESEIKKKSTLSEENKNSIYKRVLENIIISIILLILFLFIDLGYERITKERFITDLKALSMLSLLISIIIFEIAYRKDSDKLAINGIEILCFAIICLFLPYTFFYLNNVFKLIGQLIAVPFTLYYVIKCLIIKFRMKSEYIKALSDIKDIIK